MKKLLIMGMAAVAMAAAADEKIMDIRPDAELAKGAPTGVDWHSKNGKALAEAVKPEVLAAIAKDAAKADALCAAVKPAYFTDPLKAHQIGAVTQYVMLPANVGCKCRKTWAAALIKAGKAATDDYVRTFFLDQLRWCGCDKCIPAVREIAAKGGAQLKETGELVARELKGKK